MTMTPNEAALGAFRALAEAIRESYHADRCIWLRTGKGLCNCWIAEGERSLSVLRAAMRAGAGRTETHRLMTAALEAIAKP